MFDQAPALLMCILYKNFEILLQSLVKWYYYGIVMEKKSMKPFHFRL